MPLKGLGFARRPVRAVCLLDGVVAGGDEAACLAQAEERIASIIETYDPDLSGIV